jgi:hypothetical protein
MCVCMCVRVCVCVCVCLCLCALAHASELITELFSGLDNGLTYFTISINTIRKDYIPVVLNVSIFFVFHSLFINEKILHEKAAETTKEK